MKKGLRDCGKFLADAELLMFLSFVFFIRPPVASNRQGVFSEDSSKRLIRAYLAGSAWSILEICISIARGTS